MKYGVHDRRSGQRNDKNNPEIRREGDAIILPRNLTLTQAQRVLARLEEEESMERCIQERVPVSPHEGAIALAKAIKEMFGFVLESERGSDISIDIGPRQTMKVRWGRYDLPMGGYIETDAVPDEDGRAIFQLHAHVEGKHEHSVRALIEKVREFASGESPYKGKAFSITLTGNDGSTLQMPKIKFLDLSAEQITVIFRRGIERDLQSSIWGPIEHTEAVRAMGTPLRRGILLAGTYGTGKTLTATETARRAVKNGWTFLYLPKAAELSQALAFARQYEPCIIFVEDIDRLTGATRTNEVNQILNALDGIGNKNSEVMVVFTTNFPDQVNQAMRRPGRIDSAVNILPPDAETAIRLVTHYAGKFLAPGQDLTKVGAALDGVIPAQIREVVERAKLAVVAEGKTEIVLTDGDLEYAAESVGRENTLFAGKSAEQPTTGLDAFAHRLGTALVDASVRGNGHATPVATR